MRFILSCHFLAQRANQFDNDLIEVNKSVVCCLPIQGIQISLTLCVIVG